MESVDLLVSRWLELDRNAATRAEILGLVAQKDHIRLHALLANPLQFGTAGTLANAGLRAEMGAGFARMNELTVIQASQGICARLMRDPHPAMSIVVGHDHRHNSVQFAQLTAAVFLAKNIRVHYFPAHVHTPLVPFAVTHFGAACGIMITASHNPKKDNGYKVYWQNGCQIIPPLDSEIAQCISDNQIPWTWDYNLVSTSPLVSDPTTEATNSYFAKVKALSVFGSANQSQHVKFAYTPMHGVGLLFAQKAFSILGLHDFYPVPEQMHPDPEFPTVAYPNPEEGQGALALAQICADRNSASVIFANDPDADRLAVAEKVDGEWRIFNGNQIGIILASFALDRTKKMHNGFYFSNLGVIPSNTAVLNTTVSSHMLQAMAEDENITFEETLTGFKWLGNRTLQLRYQGKDVIFAYEEAIGFMVGDFVADKDGVSAMAVFAEWTNYLYSTEKTLSSHLTSLYEKYGFWVSNNGYFICHDPATIKLIFNKIRHGSNGPEKTLQYPSTIGGSKVVSIRDLTAGFDSSTTDNKPTLPTSSSSQMITFTLENSCVITLRTSGTEPKIKYYTEFKGNSLEQATASLAKVVAGMIEELLQPKQNSLIN